jgi:hypothetical protein
MAVKGINDIYHILSKCKLYICVEVKKATSIYLLFAIILQSFGSLVIVAGYELNKEYITKHFCVNRNKPMMHCNGKCHLNKELKSEQKKEQSPVSPIKEKQESNQYFQNYSEHLFSLSKIISEVRFYYCTQPSQEFYKTVFHPPCS